MSIDITGLTKCYGKKKALDNVTFSLETGIYGLLGVNGAGKTTLINILVTALEPTAGHVFYNGTDIRRETDIWLSDLGYMPQNLQFYRNYSVEEFLRYIAVLKKLKDGKKEKISELLEFVNLSEYKKQKIGALSGGMLRRVGIAQALLNDPKILILDEPTAGLDPKERIRFRNLISNIAENRIILLATHIVEDIEYIADGVIFLHDGKLVRQAHPDVLCAEIDGKVWSVTVNKQGLSMLMGTHRISSIQPDRDVYHVRIVDDEKPHPDAVNISGRLEDYFLYHVGEVAI